MTPSVSVLMPAYNTRRYIAKAMRSILDGTLRDLELIVADDGSTDGTADVADVLAKNDPRVRVLRLPHAGVSNVNKGVDACRGEFIARMDSDDVAHADRLAKQLNFLRQHADHVAVGCSLVRTDPEGNPAGEQHPPATHAAIDAALLRCDGSAIVQGTTMFRRSALLAVGGWRDTYGWVEDLDLFLRLGEIGKLANIDEVLYRYRRHPRSVCATHYTAMCGKLEAMLTEAYRRRGLGTPPPIAELRPDLGRSEGVADLYRSWACHAIHHGNAKVARRHALHALRHQPFKGRNWRVLGWALAA